MVIGYMSVRAHANFIGIPAVSGLGVVAYLAECYVFFVSTLAYLFIDGVIALLLMGLAGLILGPIYGLRSYQHLFRWGASGSAWLSRSRQGWFTTIALLACLVMGMLWSLAGPVDVAVGALNDAVLQQTTQYLFNVALIGILVVGGSWYIGLSGPHPHGHSHAARAAVALLLGIAAILLPALHGRLIRPPLYPVAAVAGKDSAREECGLLVLFTDESAVIWTAAGSSTPPIGIMRLYPQHEVRSIAHGALANLLDVAHDTIAGRNPLSDKCNSLRTPADAMPRK